LLSYTGSRNGSRQYLLSIQFCSADKVMSPDRGNLESLLCIAIMGLERWEWCVSSQRSFVGHALTLVLQLPVRPAKDVRLLADLLTKNAAEKRQLWSQSVLISYMLDAFKLIVYRSAIPN
jgi:hypothetical protein